ncbi:hypothetical protein SAMN06272737_114118 [Blastococcus mobilis]|uniref:Uncharacterized protein n=1 Tax=Blastococcus mobilis TaxID=1938746 RepID=A0A238XLQ7_9ACTN|nr:hypothetical protein SAMN06272737_114118 [Blastococcus mobilis]
MTERPPPLRDPRWEEAAECHPTENSPETVSAGCAVPPITIGTCGFISSGEPEGS